MKSTDNDAQRVIAEIDVQTRKGRDLLHRKEYTECLKCFDIAYIASKSLMTTTNTNGVPVLDKQAVCSFNMAAVLQASKKPQAALEWLQVCVDHLRHSPAGPPTKFDLYYSFGVCEEMQHHDQDAVKYYELSLELCEESSSDTESGFNGRRARLIGRMARLYSRLNDTPQAAVAHKMAAEIYNRSDTSTQRLYHLCKLATQLYRGGRHGLALDVAGECFNESQLQDSHSSDTIYNELALLFTRCGNHETALSCLELALPICKADDIKATILQNLGAAHNNRGEYELAVDYHSRAAALHGRLRNRRAQCGCFLNLAYAHARRDLYEAASECYLHAHQAALDVGSRHDAWRALEGRGCTAFKMSRYGIATANFTAAMDVLNEMTKRSESDELALVRIQLKIDDTSRHELQESSKSTISSGDISEYSKGILNIKDSKRRSRKSLSRKLTKLQRQFESIALGIGEYDSGTDQSALSRNRYRSNKSPRAMLWDERTRPQTARPDNSTGLQHYDHIDKKNKKKVSLFERISDKCSESALLNDPPRLAEKKRKKKHRNNYDLLDAQGFRSDKYDDNASQDNLQSARHLRRSLEKVKSRQLRKSDSLESSTSCHESDNTICNDLQRLPPPSRTDTLTSPFASRGDGYDDDDPLCKTATYMEPVQFKRNFRSDAAPSTKSNNSISNYFSEQERDVPLVTPEPLENTYETLKLRSAIHKDSQLCTIL